MLLAVVERNQLLLLLLCGGKSTQSLYSYTTEILLSFK